MNNPWMRLEEIELMKKYLGHESTVLEYGSGNSTAWFASQVKKVFSIEHDASWHNKVKSDTALFKNAELYLVEPEIVWNSDRDGTLDEFKKYVNLPETLNIQPDFVLIDGRARVSCCRLVSRLYPNSIIAFHDYWSRSRDRFHDYHECLDSVEIIDQAQDMAVMRPK